MVDGRPVLLDTVSVAAVGARARSLANDVGLVSDSVASITSNHSFAGHCSAGTEQRWSTSGDSGSDLASSVLSAKAFENVAQRQADRFCISSVAVFHIAFLERTVTNCDPVRDADEIRICEFHTWTFAAIV